MSKSDEGTSEPVPGRRSETAASPPTKPETGPGDMQSYIGARLRQAFDDIASQPVPDRFLQLMRDLDKK